MAGCHLSHSLEMPRFRGGSGSGMFAVDLPSDVDLSDGKSDLQASLSAPGARGAGLLAANGGEVLCGNR